MMRKLPFAPPQSVIATLIKRITDDGFFEVKNHVSLGKTYEIDLSTIRVGYGYNYIKRKFWKRKIVSVKDSNNPDGWIPIELLMWKGQLVK